MAKEATKMRLFPRGFLGADQGPQVERTPQPFTQQVLHQQYHINTPQLQPGRLIANPHVEAVYSQYIKQTAKIGSFDFREKVVIAAIEAFGTSNFAFWYSAQHKVSTCGDMHNRFLSDTLKFIVTGRRDLPLETWQNLIAITDEGNPVGELSDYAKEFFGMSATHPHTARYNYQLTEVLQQWLSHPTGHEDLLGTLHILFGKV